MIGPCKNSQPTANICIKDNCFISEGVLEPHYMSNKLGSPPDNPRPTGDYESPWSRRDHYGTLSRHQEGAWDRYIYSPFSWLCNLSEISELILCIFSAICPD